MMNRKQEIKNKMKKSGGFCCISEEIDNMSSYIKQKYGSPYGNQTCDWS